jgi:hypothetical protein
MQSQSRSSLLLKALHLDAAALPKSSTRISGAARTLGANTKVGALVKSIIGGVVHATETAANESGRCRLSYE